MRSPAVMTLLRSCVVSAAVVIFAALSSSSPARAQDRGTVLTEQSVRATALPDGISITAHGIVIQVTALRQDVLRVRAGQAGQLPEDASWAVLASARTASVATTPEIGGGNMGFHTAALRVRFDADLRLTVTDLAGNVLQRDSRPIEWRGNAFHVYKEKFQDTHFFGLGDKPGPLDRA